MSEDQEKKRVHAAFNEAVNMTPKALDAWLETPESKSVGQDDGSGEATGHKSGHIIVAIKHKKQADLTDDDYAQMKRVTSYVHRHLAQRPKGEGREGDVSHTRWAYSLKNWGHDPTK